MARDDVLEGGIPSVGERVQKLKELARNFRDGLSGPRSIRPSTTTNDMSPWSSKGRLGVRPMDEQVCGESIGCREANISVCKSIAYFWISKCC